MPKYLKLKCGNYTGQDQPQKGMMIKQASFCSNRFFLVFLCVILIFTQLKPLEPAVSLFKMIWSNKAWHVRILHRLNFRTDVVLK